MTACFALMATFAAMARAVVASLVNAGRHRAAEGRHGQEAGMKLGRVPSVATALSILVGSAWVAMHTGSDTPVAQRERTKPSTALASVAAESPAHARLQ